MFSIYTCSVWRSVKITAEVAIFVLARECLSTSLLDQIQGQLFGFSADNPLPVLIHFRSRSNPPIGGGLAGSRSDLDKSAYAKMRTSADRIDLDPIAIEALVRTGLKTGVGPSLYRTIFYFFPSMDQSAKTVSVTAL